MSDKDIFQQSSDQSTTNQTSTTQSTSVDPDSKLALLVGEGRKYKTVEELAKAYVNVDEFVETLKGENQKLREDVSKAKTLDEVLERLKGTTDTTTTDKGGTTATTSSGLTVQDVTKIVSNTISGMETQRSKETNLKAADAKMKELFGEKAQEVFDKEAATPAMRDALINLASVSPEKFVAMFQPVTNSAGSQVDSTTSVNTTALNANAGNARALNPECAEFYKELRKKNPAQYYSQAIQTQMHRAATKDPGKYFGRS